MTKVNLATVLAMKTTMTTRSPDLVHAMVPADVLEDLLDDLIQFHTCGLDKPTKKKGKK